ncbi:MAG: hypothetical protein FJZ58_07065 [Chlamydiae bacterium]|nr:hypothetical protein [Chlamydiota bacterium]
MKKNHLLFLLLPLFFFCSCSHHRKAPDDSTLVSIQVIDRNGFSETISTKDRLSRYQNTDFCQPQPYQKVLRVFGKDIEGKTPSTITSYHPNGHLWQYLEICDGRAHGLYREWHLNGKQKMELHVIEGIPELSDTALNSWVFDGLNTVWDEEGALVAQIPYDKGMMQGDSLYYYPNGHLKKKIPYSQDLLQGDLLCYYEEGTLAEIIPHDKGVRSGTATSLFPDGTIAYEEQFSNDLLLEGKYYLPSSETTTAPPLLCSIEKGNGKRAEREHGSSSIRRLVTYRGGLPEGLVECFDEEGHLKISFSQKQGKKQGEEWEYYPKKQPQDSLQPKLLLHWQEDILQGIVKTWFPNGIQESQKEMYQNKKNGLFLAWYVNGDLMLSEEYEKDLLISGSYYKKGDKKPVSRVLQGKGLATLYNVDGYLLQKVSYDKGLPLLEGEAP